MLLNSWGSRRQVSIPSCTLNEVHVVLGLSDIIDEAATLAIYQGLPDLPGFDLLSCALSNLSGGAVLLDPSLARLLYEHNGYVADFSLELYEELLMELVGVLRDDIKRAMVKHHLEITEARIAGWVGREPILRIKHNGAKGLRF